MCSMIETERSPRAHRDRTRDARPGRTGRARSRRCPSSGRAPGARARTRAPRSATAITGENRRRSDRSSRPRNRSSSQTGATRPAKSASRARWTPRGDLEILDDVLGAGCRRDGRSGRPSATSTISSPIAGHDHTRGRGVHDEPEIGVAAFRGPCGGSPTPDARIQPPNWPTRREPGGECTGVAGCVAGDPVADARQNTSEATMPTT